MAESTLENFKSRLDQLGTTENFENVENVQEQIEEAFALLYVRLNTEKELLLKAVKEIKDEKYFKKILLVTLYLVRFKIRDTNFLKAILLKNIFQGLDENGLTIEILIY